MSHVLSVAKLGIEIYERDAITLARALLGTHLVHRSDGQLRAGRIVETEAYVGPHDLACHAAKGLTSRTRVMFGPPGFSYVYLIYGRYHCFNVVCERDGYAAAVLVRALEPDRGVAASTKGPGLLCDALGITRAHNGIDLTGDLLWIEDRGTPAVEIVATPRIGVDYAGEWAAKPLRFVDAASAWLSRRLTPSVPALPQT